MAQPRELGRVGLWRVFSLREVDEVVVDGLEQLAPVSLQPGTDVRHERPLLLVGRVVLLDGIGAIPLRPVRLVRVDPEVVA